MTRHTPLLIVGAGPFGLSLAAWLEARGMSHVVLGEPMGFWSRQMPPGMLLRSACDWHLDPDGTDTIVRYLETEGLTPKDVEPLSLATYLAYARWFQERKGLEVVGRFVRRLDRAYGEGPPFRATLEDGGTITADRVVVALGFSHFPHVPEDLSRGLPADRFSHTSDLVDFELLRGKRCLVVGGRQGALEWAALMLEAGVEAVHVSHRHPTPAFQEADWSWVSPLVDGMVADPGWFRRLSPTEKEGLSRRLWAEGRLKVEPWLAPRLADESVRLWPDTRVVACAESPGGDLEVTLDPGPRLRVDHVVFATGYQVRLGRIPFLARGDVLDSIRTEDGYPVLDEGFQSSVPGLFFTSMPATRDFGPFFAFTVSVRTSARIIGRALQAAPA